MCVERVAGQSSVGQVVLETLGRRHLFHLVVHRADLIFGQTVFRLQHRASTGGLASAPRRIKLKRTMGNSHVVPTSESRERLLEPALAEIAPGTDDVRPDIDLHLSKSRTFHASSNQRVEGMKRLSRVIVFTVLATWFGSPAAPGAQGS